MRKIIIAIIILVTLVGGFLVYNHYKRPEITVAEQNYLKECALRSKVQNEAYETDPLASTTTFEKYKVPVYKGTMALLNMKTSSREAKKFVTMINENLDGEGVNFAGKYTIVGVGMTGWGMNYFLIDRTNGKGIPFPYYARYVDTQEDSSLIIINSKVSVFSDLEDVDTCSSTGMGYDDVYTDLRPYYYSWNGTEFVQLGNKIQINPFWKGYFK